MEAGGGEASDPTDSNNSYRHHHVKEELNPLGICSNQHLNEVMNIHLPNKVIDHSTVNRPHHLVDMLNNERSYKQPSDTVECNTNSNTSNTLQLKKPNAMVTVIMNTNNSNEHQINTMGQEGNPNLSENEEKRSRPCSTTRKKRNFTPTEDDKIVEGFNKHGRAWIKISETLDGRTPVQIRDRFRRIKKLDLASGVQRDDDSCSESSSPIPTQSLYGSLARTNSNNNFNSTIGSSCKRRVEPVEPPCKRQKPPESIDDWILGKLGSTTQISDSFMHTPVSTSYSSSPVRLNSLSSITNDVSGDEINSSVDQNLHSHLNTSEEKSYYTQADMCQAVNEAVSELNNKLSEQLEWMKQAMAQKEEAWRLKEQQLREQELRYRERVMQELQAILITYETEQRRYMRERLSEENARLGIVTYNELLSNGKAYLLHRAKAKDIDEERESVEQAKKRVHKRKIQMNYISGNSSTGNLSNVTNPPVATGSKSLSQEMEDIVLQEQLLKCRSIALKNSEADAARELEILEIGSALHAKEYRRIQEEDISKWNRFPLLNKRYLILGLLGKGGFSEVYRAYDIFELRQVACKMHQFSPCWSQEKKVNHIRHAERECEIHKALSHPRIVRLYDHFEIDKDTFCTVLQYCKGGDLDSYLKRHRSLSENEARIITAQIFQGLKHLVEGEQKVIHYDLKPGNILFDEDGYIKITDFGLSKIIDSNSDAIELTSQGAGTYWYLPPECFERNHPHISNKVDVWSAGVILYQMLFGCKPFGNGYTQKAIREQNLIHPDLEVDFPEKPGKKISDEAKVFLQRCLNPSEAKRSDVLTLSADPWLSFLATLPPKKNNTGNLPGSFESSTTTPKKMSVSQGGGGNVPPQNKPSCVASIPSNKAISNWASLAPSGLLTSGGILSVAKR